MVLLLCGYYSENRLDLQALLMPDQLRPVRVCWEKTNRPAREIPRGYGNRSAVGAVGGLDQTP